MSSTQQSALTLRIVPSDEERAIRKSVPGICLGSGEDHPQRCQEAGEPPAELWEALSAAGFTGIDILRRRGEGAAWG